MKNRLVLNAWNSIDTRHSEKLLYTGWRLFAFHSFCTRTQGQGHSDCRKVKFWHFPDKYRFSLLAVAAIAIKSTKAVVYTSFSVISEQNGFQSDYGTPY